MRCQVSFSPTVGGRGVVRLGLAALALALLGGTPAHLSAQQDTTVHLREGDRIRVWSSDAGWEGREFDIVRRSPRGLQLRVPDATGGPRLSPSQIDRMQLRTRSGNRLGEGMLIGGGVGLAASTTLSALICSGPDYRAGLGCTLEFLFTSRLALIGGGAGALLGAIVGAPVPEHEWVTVEVGPAMEVGPPGRSAPQGGAVRVELRVPAIP